MKFSAIPIALAALWVVVGVIASNVGIDDSAWKVQAQFTVQNDPALLQALDYNQEVLAEALGERRRIIVEGAIGVSAGKGLRYIKPRYASRITQDARYYLVDIYLQKGPPYKVSRRKLKRAAIAVATAFSIAQNFRRDFQLVGSANYTLGIPGTEGAVELVAFEGSPMKALETMLALSVADLQSEDADSDRATGRLNSRSACPGPIALKDWQAIRTAASPISDFDHTLDCGSGALHWH